MQPSTPQDLAGRAIGPYRLDALLGQGGMGAVFRATHLASGQAVAMKMLLPELASDEALRRRFVREAEAMVRLRHPGIPAVYELLDDPQGFFMAMEYVEGDTFEALLEREGRLDPERALELLAPIVEAVAFAHEHGVIHRDIKPANLMALRAGGCKVMDFGTAKVADARDKLTLAGTTLGTVCYMSPEQLMGRDPLPPSADVYSLATTLFEMVTGRLPFYDEENELALMKQIIRDAPPAPRSLRPDLPEAVERLLLRGLAKDPAARFASAADFGRALDETRRALVAARAPASTPAPSPTPAPRSAAEAQGAGGPGAAPSAADPGVETGALPAPLGGSTEPRPSYDRRVLVRRLGVVAASGLVLCSAGVGTVVGFAASPYALAAAITGAALAAAGAAVLLGGLVAARRAIPTDVEPPASEAAVRCLEALAGPLAGQRIDLGAATALTIGRDPSANALALADPAVSSRHARIEPYQGRWLITDLGSTNGTFVNGVRVAQAELTHDAVLAIGASRFAVRLPAAARSAAAVPSTPARAGA